MYVCTMYTVNSISESELILECFSYTVPVTSLSSLNEPSALEAKCKKRVLFTSFIIVAYQENIFFNSLECQGGLRQMIISLSDLV